MGPADPSPPEHRRVARALDASLYALATVALVTTLLTPVSLASGAGLVGVKYGLFVVGFAQVGLAIVRIWPTDPDDVAVSGGQSIDDESGFQRAVQRLIPTERLRLHPRHRLPAPYRVLLAGVGSLLLSLSLEMVLGVPG